jgi:D-sedoheptulose 7-phosphate isomerase
MLEQRIQQHIFDSADLQYRSADTLARPVAEAAAALLAALTSGGKVLVCGSGAGAVLAPHLARLFTGRFERVRPPLAALALATHPPQAALEVRALGLPGDVLLFIDDAEGIGISNALTRPGRGKQAPSAGGCTTRKRPFERIRA